MDTFCYLCFMFFFVMLSCLFLAALCWESADLFALLCVMFSCVFVTFSFGVSGLVQYLIVSIPDLRLLHFAQKFLLFETYDCLGLEQRMNHI